MFKIYTKTVDFFKKHAWLQEVFVFLIFFAIYLSLQSNVSFADPDAFYHLKISELTAAHGPVRSFGWLPFTTLAGSYADHHFLYHLALIPFVKIFGSFAGLRIATAVFAAMAIAGIGWALRYLNISLPFVWAIIAGIMNPLAFRINLAKASAPGVIFLTVGLVMAIQRRAWPLGILAFFYVWTHGGWPSLLVLGTLAILIMTWGRSGKNNVIASEAKQSLGSITMVAKFTRLLRRLRPPRNDGFKPLLALWSGTILGLVVNPFFPQNLKFYWEQIVQIAIVNYQSVIGVGNEWYPYGFSSLAADLPLLFIFGAAAIMIFPAIVSRDEKRGQGTVPIRVALALSAAAIIFFVMVLRSRRHVEYFVPLAVLAIASWFGELPFEKIWVFMKRNVIIIILLCAAALSMAGVYANRSLARVKSDLNGSYRYTLYKEATQFLIANTTDNEVVLHADWDEMPSLFYWDDKNRYIMGLDPTFMYNAGHDRYWRYVNFTLGKSTNPVGVMNEFGARFVLSDDKHSAFNAALEKSGHFEKVYSDKDARIYRLKP